MIGEIVKLVFKVALLIILMVWPGIVVLFVSPGDFGVATVAVIMYFFAFVSIGVILRQYWQNAP